MHADRGEAERDGERNAERAQQQEEDKKGDAHGFCSLSGTLTSASTAWPGGRPDFGQLDQGRVAYAAIQRWQGWRGARKSA